MWERGATHDGQRSNTLLLAATSAAILTLVPVAAHQVGLLSHLPDPSGALFASDEIADSKAAHPLGMPDAVAGLASYATTMTLALMTPSHPKARRPLAATLVGDGAVAGFNVVRQVVSFGKICSWCTGTAVCTAAMLIAGRRLISDEATNLLRRI